MYRGAKPKFKELGCQLLAYETAHTKSRVAKDSVAFPVCEKLREPLRRLIGAAGFHALLSRALTLAALEFPSLPPLEIGGDGSLKNLNDMPGSGEGRPMADVEVIVVGQLLGLLETFIGEALTLRLIQDIWRHLPASNFEDKQPL